MDSPLAPFQTFKARAASLREVYCFCVFIVSGLCLCSTVKTTCVATSTTVCDLVYVPEESDLTEQFLRFIFF